MSDERRTELVALARLEEKVEHLDERMEQLLQGQRQNFKCLSRSLHGSGDAPGLVVRVDRVEQWRGRQGKLLGILLTTVLPLALVRIWETFKGGA